MELSIGHYFWVSCEVKPGPFPDERMVRLHSQFMDWLGFTSVNHLKDPILEGKTCIRILILDIKDNRFFARVPGEGIANDLYNDVVSSVQACDVVQT
jgi:hypothetical protein